MKILYLIRHAKSSWDNPEELDIERPLNKRGKKDAPLMGEKLRMQGIMPDFVISSPAKRTIATAKIITKSIKYPKRIIEKQELYHPTDLQLLNTIKHIHNDKNAAMIFTHHPGITDFVNRICQTNYEKIPTTGVVCIAFDTNNWERIKYDNASLLFLDYPKRYKNEN